MRYQNKPFFFLIPGAVAVVSLALWILYVDPSTWVLAGPLSIHPVVILLSLIALSIFCFSSFFLKNIRWATLLTFFVITSLLLKYLGYANIFFYIILAALCIAIELLLRQILPYRSRRNNKL